MSGSALIQSDRSERMTARQPRESIHAVRRGDVCWASRIGKCLVQAFVTSVIGGDDSFCLC